MISPHIPLRLTVDLSAIQANWRWLNKMSGTAACGAAVKANAYGLGAERVVPALLEAGCRDFFVTTYAEAEPLLPLMGEGASLSLLHGVAKEDIADVAAAPPFIRPILNSRYQIERWKEAAPERACDVMVDTGMNRLGLSTEEAVSGMLDGLQVDTLLSHLASADEDVPQNERQRRVFEAIASKIPAKRRSLANSAGILLGTDYAFDLTRPGLALYGGVPRGEGNGHIRPVIKADAQVVQKRTVRAGDTIGYNATFTASQDMEIAILNVGYADGYFRGFSNSGKAQIGNETVPVLGRISMDLIAIQAPVVSLSEGDWVEVRLDLPEASRQSGLSQYEILTSLGARYDRTWI